MQLDALTPPAEADGGPQERVSRLRPGKADGRPMLKQAVVLAWALGRALRERPRLASWQETADELTPLLAEFRRPGEHALPNPARPIAALYRAGLWSLEGFEGTVPTGHGHPEHWFNEQTPDGGLASETYDLVKASPDALRGILDLIIERFDLDPDETASLFAATGLPRPEPGNGSSHLKTAYERLCRIVEEHETPGSRRPSQHDVPLRLVQARSAVLIRSQGRCEHCGTPAPDVTDRGDPVLEVDHVQGLAEGGRDHPEQMVALCPNCHAVKTRGTTRHQLTERLRQIAGHRHRDLLG